MCIYPHSNMYSKYDISLCNGIMPWENIIHTVQTTTYIHTYMQLRDKNCICYITCKYGTLLAVWHFFFFVNSTYLYEEQLKIQKHINKVNAMTKSMFVSNVHASQMYMALIWLRGLIKVSSCFACIIYCSLLLFLWK